MIDIPKCYKKGCAHYIGVKKSGKATCSYCKAYPEGIPNEIAYGDNDHSKVQKGQKGDFVFEKGAMDEEVEEVSKGGPGSGNYGHAGIPGHRGGSAPGKGGKRSGKRGSGKIRYQAGKNTGLFNVEWEADVPSAATKKEMAKIKKCGINRVALENNANGSYVAVANKIITDVQVKYPYVQEYMSKHKIDLYLTGEKNVEAMGANGKMFSIVGSYDEGEITLTKKGLDNAYRGMSGSPVVKGDAGKPPFSSSNGMVHEIGHHLKDNDKRINEFTWYDLWKKEKKNKQFTMYGRTDEDEGFAESFALYTHPKGREHLLPDTVAFFDKYLKVKKKKKELDIGLGMIFKMGTSASGNRGHAGRPGKVGGSSVAGKVKPKKRTDFRNMTREDAAELLGSSHGMPKARWDRLWEISRHGRRKDDPLPKKKKPKDTRVGLARMTGFAYSDKLDEKEYAKLPAVHKVRILKDKIGNYKERYVPKTKQKRTLSKLSTKGKKMWTELNKKVGAMEGMRRAMVARGDMSSRIEQRKHYHFAISLQENAIKLKQSMKGLK